MAGELIDFGRRISKLADPEAVKRVAMAAGFAAKDAAIEVAERDLGSDRSFSGLKRKVPLGAGFDVVGWSQIRLNLRPAGLWKLAESGRRKGVPIRPKSRRAAKSPPHAKAVLTPEGWRARSTTGAWGGKGTFTAAVRKARVEVPKAARKQFRLEVAKVVR